MSVLWFPLLTFGLGGLGQEAKPAPAAACELSWTGPGTYSNLWGFALTLPADRKAYSNSPVSGCGDDMVVMGDHGIVIPLSVDPREADRFVEVDSGYNSNEYRTVAEAVDSRLRWIRERAVEGTVRILRRSAMSLDRLEGVRIVAKYRSREGGREVVEDLLEFLRPSRTKRGTLPGYYVSIHLRSPQNTYATDLREFETLLLSVRFSEPQK